MEYGWSIWFCLSTDPIFELYSSTTQDGFVAARVTDGRPLPFGAGTTVSSCWFISICTSFLSQNFKHRRAERNALTWSLSNLAFLTSLGTRFDLIVPQAVVFFDDGGSRTDGCWCTSCPSRLYVLRPVMVTSEDDNLLTCAWHWTLLWQCNINSCGRILLVCVHMETIRVAWIFA